MSRKILVVDDEGDIVEYLKTLLEDNDFSVSTASNGAEALEMIKNDRPDLVLLDLQMPEETGTGFYRKMRNSESLKDIPVIVASGLAGRNVAVSKSVPVLEKPLDETKVLDAIDRVLGE